MTSPAQTVSEWVEYIQTLHHRDIDLKLDRVEKVFRRCFAHGFGPLVIKIGGTNGKGSTAEILRSIYHQQGYRVGKYTSPHLTRYNERFVINQTIVQDDELIEAMWQVEQRRGDIGLTFFEFGTLTALQLFSQADMDVVILEVGLGGRLDATNVVNAALTIITNVSLDHTQWLGSTIDAIAAEKIASCRSHAPCIIGMRDPPLSIFRYCDLHHIPLYILGRDFKPEARSDSWKFSSKDNTFMDLPMPFLHTAHQLDNAACALCAVTTLNLQRPVQLSSVINGLVNAKIVGRCQIVRQKPLIVVDVAHNPAAVAHLANFVSNQGSFKRYFALCGMLKDKDIEGNIKALGGIIDRWYLADIPTSRGATAHHLAHVINHLSAGETTCYEGAMVAWHTVIGRLHKGDCLIVFGSFYIVGDIITVLSRTGAICGSYT